MASVKIDALAEAVARELREYRQEMFDDLCESIDDAADTCVASLRLHSPKLTASYKKGWRKKVAHKSKSDIRIQVHNKTDYQLTHLLEDGHYVRNKPGGPIVGFAPAQPHIQPAADEAARILEKNVKIRVGLK